MTVGMPSMTIAEWWISDADGDCDAVGACDADNNLCTADKCNGPKASDCIHTPTVCSDHSPCTKDSCDPKTGCNYELTVDCNDDNPCTLDVCQGAKKEDCAHYPASLPCNDGNNCTVIDSCINGGCAGAQLACYAADNLCGKDGCTPEISQTNNPIVDLSAGDLHVCTRRLDGTTNCWGKANFYQPGKANKCTAGASKCAVWDKINNHGQVYAPQEGDPLTNVKLAALSAGARHNCGLKADGTPVCWGRSENGQTTPPGGMTFEQLAAGNLFTCGLQKHNGAIRCWGSSIWLTQEAVSQGTVPTTVPGLLTMKGGPYNQIAMWGRECRTNSTTSKYACGGMDTVCGLSLPTKIPLNFATKSTANGAFGVNYPASGQIRCWMLEAKNYGKTKPLYPLKRPYGCLALHIG